MNWILIWKDNANYTSDRRERCVFSGITHLVVAIILWYFLFPGAHPLLVAIGSLLPDIDTRKSFLGRFIPGWIFFKHRGFLHSLGGMLLICGAVAYFGGGKYGISLAFGYLIHLAMDSITPQGIRWLGRKRKNGRYRKK